MIRTEFLPQGGQVSQSSLYSHFQIEDPPERRARSQVRTAAMLAITYSEKEANGGLGKVKRQRKGYFPRDLPQRALLQGQPAQNLWTLP